MTVQISFAVRRAVPALLLAATIACAATAAGTGIATPIPAPKVDAPLARATDQKIAVFAGGCFWGIQAVFQHVHGVIRAVSGYAGGTMNNPSYEDVSSGTTGHAESVKVTFDPSQVTFGTLLRVFFSVAHNPTELNRQGPDSGTQYRSAVFFVDPEQQRIAQAYIAQLDDAQVFGDTIVTEVAPLSGFFDAEAYHQNYATNHPDDMYIRINDAPKVANLKATFPELYVR
jgi:peptide-methionine (S)-S-oxide reductase